MGLAASQARFLGLTARKSNVEYEGQQVNQQRTALANESASLYAQLTNLVVPTPPDVTSYYYTEYSFKYNDTTYVMSALPIRNNDGTYTVGLNYETQVGNFQEVDSNLGLDFSKSSVSTLGNYPDLKKRMGEGYDDDTPINMISANDKFYYQVGKDKDARIFKYNTNDVLNNKIFNDATIRYNQSGDYESISIPELGGKSLAVSSTAKQDTEAYDLAMNEYNKKYNEYEKTIATINAKTQTIQQQDKTLELRLNQLDTEQDAIGTEMDAVTKVIEKNVQSTFKTFG